MHMNQVSFFDAKPYDRDSFGKETEIDWRFFTCRLTEETAEQAKGSQAVVSFVNCRLDRPCLKKLKSLGVAYIALRCTGYNHIDLTAAREMGFKVTYVPVYSPYAVAEHAAALLLTLNRKIHLAYNRVSEKNFTLDGLLGMDLHGKTAALIGGGRIGLAAAQIFRGIGMEILLVDPFENPEWKGCYSDLESALEKSDVVSLHVPLSDSTFHLMNKSRFNQMKRGSLLINTSRGAVIETKALIEALVEKRIAGAAIDVYEKEAGVFFEDFRGKSLEDPDLNHLLGMPNVIVTPHQGFFTKEALDEIRASTAGNLLAFFKGEPPLTGTSLL